MRPNVARCGPGAAENIEHYHEAFSILIFCIDELKIIKLMIIVG